MLKVKKEISKKTTDKIIKVKGKKNTYTEFKMNEEDIHTFGEYILCMRQRMGLSQTLFSEKYKVRQSYVCNLEGDKGELTSKKLKIACTIFELSFNAMKKRFLKHDVSEESLDFDELLDVCVGISKKVDKILVMMNPDYRTCVTTKGDKSKL